MNKTKNCEIEEVQYYCSWIQGKTLINKNFSFHSFIGQEISSFWLSLFTCLLEIVSSVNFCFLCNKN